MNLVKIYKTIVIGQIYKTANLLNCQIFEQTKLTLPPTFPPLPFEIKREIRNQLHDQFKKEIFR